MDSNDDLRACRAYYRPEVAAMLNIPEAWLRGWVADRSIPHQRRGKPGPRQRGVWFTYDDVLEIGRMLPDLMTSRRANTRAEGRTTATGHSEPAPTVAACPESVQAPGAEVSDDLLMRFSQLRSTKARAVGDGMDA